MFVASFRKHSNLRGEIELHPQLDKELSSARNHENAIADPSTSLGSGRDDTLVVS
jgi:hypothetical protein